MRYTNIVFDLDGTITEPAQGITNGLVYALNHYGIKVDNIATLYKYIGPPLQETFASFGFEGDKIDEAVAIYREYYSTKGIIENELMPEIKDALVSLKKAGMKLYIATSKHEPYAVQILEYLHVAGYFDYIAGSDSAIGRNDKASVIEYLFEQAGITSENLKDTVMVGDRCFDIEGAKKAGIDSIGVLYGYGSREEFVSAGADYIVKTAKELADYLVS